MRQLCRLALFSPVFVTAAVTSPAASYVVDGNQVSHEFDGHGGLSAGATTRLLPDYPLKQQSEILDYLFLPNFGASLGVVKLEIGGDTQSTDGTEPSHMHSRDDLSCSRGYEGWLAKEAKARNPDIKVWSLSWGVPGWIGNTSGNPPTYFSDDNINYQVQWIKCLKDEYDVDSDYLGLWNERPQGSSDYIVKLRKALNTAGFERVGITVEETWQELIDKVKTNATLNASIVAGSSHYPCNSTTRSNETIAVGKKFWAGEDTPDDSQGPGGNWSGAGCWGRKLNQHFIKMNSTSSVAWAVLWSTYPGLSSNFLGNGFINATEPWSGHYRIPPVLWINAHWGQFVQPGWRFLMTSADGSSGGSSMLAEGGSYVTLVPAENDGNFTMIVETLDGSCGKQGHCNTNPITAHQSLSFALRGSLSQVSEVHLWCSTSAEQFIYRGLAKVEAATLFLEMEPDTICTATTLSNLTHGRKGAHPTPPPSAPFPKRHADDFSSYADETLAWGFADAYGSFAVRNHALTQVATAVPTGWAPTNYDPITFIGADRMSSMQLETAAIVNHTADHHYVQLCGGCGRAPWLRHGIAYGCPTSCCFNVSWTGDWSIGEEKGTIPGFKDVWHRLAVNISDNGLLAAFVDGVQVAKVANSCPSSSAGMAALGCGKYHNCGFRNFSLVHG